MTDDIVLHEDINKALDNKIDPVELAQVIYPRIEKALELANTTQEVNKIRADTEVVLTYIRRHIPRTNLNRWEQFKYTHEGDWLYLEASAKAGALWKVCEDRRPTGVRVDRSENFQTLISALDAGFKNPRDAVSCERISELHDEDKRAYEIETLTERRQATINGMENIWRMLYNISDDIDLPEGKYRVIYADPPWMYGNDQPEYHGVQDDHYEWMTIDRLCKMKVKDILEDNAVLFIWVTSPILEESFKVIKAWGFEYKTSFVWDKVKHNMGHYNSVRHELLLVCTHGSCTPDVLKLFDSVHTEERKEHSRKPEHFRKIIDTIYPRGRRIELFARRKTEGWDVFGNEQELCELATS